MIEIKFYQNGFQASGHAFTAPYGQDLVCAGVSAVVMGSLNWFDAPDTKIQIDNTHGISCFFDETIYPEYTQWLTLLEKQLLALNQPEVVKIYHYKTKGDSHDN